MIMAFLLTGLLLSLVFGGYWRSIWRKRFRIWPLILVSLMVEAMLAAPWFARVTAGGSAEPFLRASLAAMQYGALTVFLLANRRKPGVWLVLAGSLSNGLVIIANGGRMPLTPLVARYGADALARIEAAPHYFIAEGSEPLLWLGDMIEVSLVGVYLVSAGDLLIAAGCFLLGAYLPRRILRPRRTDSLSGRQTRNMPSSRAKTGR